MVRLLKMAALGILFFAGAGLGFMVMMGFFSTSSTILAPSVEGLTVADAEFLVKAGQLKFKVQDERYDTQKEKGFVIKQNPAAGMSVKKGQTVYVTVSKGIEKIAVEDLRGLPIDKAQMRLSQNGLRLKGISYISSKEDAQVVISQSPAAGSTAPKESECFLLVSLGGKRPSFVMPDLKGRETDAVVKSLASYGMQCALDPKGEGGRTSWQKPLPGYPVDASMMIALGGRQ